MESFNSILGIPYVFHCGIVSVVFVGAVLLFVFGFKTTEEPFFNKIKADSKSAAKKKKGKDKKLLNGSVNSAENKNKGNSTVKPKSKNAEEKSKKPNALKDSKKINLNPKNAQKELDNKDVQKSKGKENVDTMSDFEVEEGLWEQALSRKKSRKNQNFIPEVLKKNDKKSSGKGSEAKKAKGDGNKIKDSARKDSTMKGDKKPKDDDGDWQEAKSSKKRRKVQKED